MACSTVIYCLLADGGHECCREHAGEALEAQHPSQCSSPQPPRCPHTPSSLPPPTHPPPAHPAICSSKSSTCGWFLRTRCGGQSGVLAVAGTEIQLSSADSSRVFNMGQAGRSNTGTRDNVLGRDGMGSGPGIKTPEIMVWAHAPPSPAPLHMLPQTPHTPLTIGIERRD